VVKQGTAWPLSSDLVATAFHVVGNREVGTWFHEALKDVVYHLEVVGRESPLTLKQVDRDPTADIAILRSAQPFDASDVMSLEADEAVEGSKWRAEGFPDYIGKDFFLTGTIEAVHRHDAHDDLQLTVNQGSNVSWEGASGSAICVGGLVEGILTEEVPRANSLWGARAAALRALLKKNGLEAEVRLKRGNYPGLARAYLRPWSVFEQFKPDRFTGRKWLEHRLDTFLSDNDRGLFIVEAEAGLGKTAFLAHLARSRDYIHHFVELAPGPDGVAPGIRSLAAQLVWEWELEPETLDVAVPGYPIRPNFLQDLLREAADRRDEKSPDKRIVLVVDALDEAGPPSAGQNILGLPRVLPKGVYLVVSHRPVKIKWDIVYRRLPVRIDAQGEKNLADMREFLEEAAEWPGVKKAIEESGAPISKTKFVATLLEKSQGVWIYLKYVLDEIETGQRSPLKLDELPQGLWGYYHRFWDKWKESHGDFWNSLELPILSTLAAAHESLTLEDLISLTRVDIGPSALGHLRHVFNVEWSPYLATSSAGTGLPSTHSYRFYHASLREFFAGSSDQRDLAHSERIFVEELAEATRQAHTRISEFFIRRWGSLDEGLPGVFNITERDHVDHYGLRYLAEHLEGAGRADDLHRLLRLEHVVGEEKAGAVRMKHLWFTACERAGQTEGYINNLARAMRLVQVADRSEFVSSEFTALIGLGIRYALMWASLTSLARNIPPALISALVKKGVWLPTQGLAYARRVPKIFQRIDALIMISIYFDKRSTIDPLQEALGIYSILIGHCVERDPRLGALKVESGLDTWDSIQKLMSLSSELASLGRAEDILDLVRSSSHDEIRLLTLVAITPHLTSDLAAVALDVAKGFGDEEMRGMALIRIAQRLGADLVPTALDVAKRFRDRRTQSSALVAIGRNEEALEIARGIEDAEDRVAALVAIARVLGADLLPEALEAVREIGDDEARGEALAVMAPHLGAGLLPATLEAVREIGDDEARGEALAALAPHLGANLLPAALNVVRGVGNHKYRALALARIAPHASADVIPELVEVARGIDNDKYRAMTLTALGEVPEALDLARRIDWGESFLEGLEALMQGLAALANISKHFRGLPTEESQDLWSEYEPLAAMALHLVTLGHVEEALELARGIGKKSDRAEVLAALAPHLAKLGRGETALAIARDIEDEQRRAEVIVELAPCLRSELLPMALELARAIEGNRAPAIALVGLTPHLSANLLPTVLEAASGFVHESSRSEVLAGLAPQLAADLLPTALEVARQIEDERELVELMAEIAPCLARLGRIAEALDLARGIENEGDRYRALAKIARCLAKQGRVREALEMTRGIGCHKTRAKALAAVASSLVTSGHLKDALVELRGIGSDEARDQALATVAWRLTKLGRVEEALDVAGGIREECIRGHMLAEVAWRLGKLGRVDEALDLARAIGDGYERNTALANVAWRLTKLGEVEKALDIVGDIGSRLYRDPELRKTLMKMLRRLTELGRVEEALRVASVVGDTDDWGEAPARVAWYLTKLGRVDEALEVSRGIFSTFERAGGLWAELAEVARLATVGRVEEALELGQELWNDERPHLHFPAIPECLARQGRVEEAMRLAQAFRRDDKRDEAMAKVVPYFAKLSRVKEALEIARGIKEAKHKDQALAAVARRLTKLGRVEEAVEAVREINGGKKRDEALLNVGWRLTKLGRVDQALEVAREIRKESIRAKALAMLKAHLDDFLLTRALEVARGITKGRDRATALRAFVPLLATLPKEQLAPLWEDTLRLSATRSRRGLLSDLAVLAPVIAALGGSEAIEELGRAIQDVGRWWP
jgi:tetratricopeptide (TPR) repeat protein